MMESSSKSASAAACGGATLIEVLVALAILSFGLAGVAAIQFRTLAYLAAVAHESRASLHAADMAERWRRAGSNGIPDAELSQWQAEIADSLPAGMGVACFDSTPRDGAADATACDGNGDLLAIKLWWDENHDGKPERMQITLLRP